MSNPVDPLRTTTAREAPASASSDGDRTAVASSPGTTAVLHFGPPAASGEVGTLGPYRVVKELGKGGMGAVYLAIDTRLNRKLALKVMLPEFAADAAAKERFLREARAVAQITQDNVVTVYEADERDGVPYIAMQFLQGYPLDQYLKTKGPPPLVHVVRIARETALGLAAAHQLGLVHRDIKPANLWLEAPNGRVKVLDFGLAKPVGSDSELTKSGAVVGTPAYMSPEQARGQKVDHRTDLFSLGGVLYRLCTGKPPFAGEHVMAVLSAVLTDDPIPVRELNPNVPDSLALLVHRLLAKKADDRPQSANEVARSLRAILEQRHAPNAASPAVASNDGGTGEISSSIPVVVQAVPHQPPAVVPMEVTARPEDAFANLGAESNDGATEAEAAPAASRDRRTSASNKRKRATEAEAARRPERKSGGKGMLVAAGAAVLLAVVAVAVVVSQMGKEPEPEAKVPDTTAPGDRKGKGDTQGPKGPSDPKGPTVPAGPLPPAYKNGMGMEFVKVPKGTGWLGGGGGKPGETKVEFKEDFYLGKYEVTQEEWQAVMGVNPSHFSRTGGGKDAVKEMPDADLKRFPVEMVSWDDCQVFIKKLNEREKEAGWVYRLPTSDEWEYACRGGPGDKADSAFDFYFAKPTNTLLPEHANFNKVLKRTCQVGTYEPNALGLYDMHGNVWEWCEDAANGADGASHRARRGGCWDNDSEECRMAIRFSDPPSVQFNSLGLRLARVRSVVSPAPAFKNGIGMEFVKVPRGTGWLGGGGGKEGDKNVEFKEDFYLGKYEVTQEEWETVMGVNPSVFKGGNEAVNGIPAADLKRFPVEMVSWDDCQVFIKKLNEREKEAGWVYRLPTEAEWEYACRGGPGDKAESTYDFYFANPTNTPGPEQANFVGDGTGLKRTCKVGSYEPNVLGLHDMHGNVHEWCSDAEMVVDGAAHRLNRSGGWFYGYGYCRATHRDTRLPSHRAHDLGLRVARVSAASAGK